MTTIRILSVDDHAFIAHGLKARIEQHQDLEFVGHVGSAQGLVAVVVETRPDVILLDLEMPGPDPFEAIQDLRVQHPDVRVIILSAHVRDHYIDSAVQAGAWGYLSKSDEPDEIISAIRAVANGKFVLGSSVRARCRTTSNKSRSRQTPSSSKLSSLSPREILILRMIGKGLTRGAIAKVTHRSPKTIDTQRMSIMEKLDIHDRGELVRFAISEGIAEL